MIKLQGRSRIITHDEKVTLFRDIATQYSKGKPVHLKEQKHEFLGTFQPLMGRELLIVPEGDRFKEQMYLWSEFDTQINDRILRAGVNFQCQQIEKWGSYTRARIVRIDVGENASD